MGRRRANGGVRGAAPRPLDGGARRARRRLADRADRLCARGRSHPPLARPLGDCDAATPHARRELSDSGSVTGPITQQLLRESWRVFHDSDGKKRRQLVLSKEDDEDYLGCAFIVNALTLHVELALKNLKYIFTVSYYQFLRMCIIEKKLEKMR